MIGTLQQVVDVMTVNRPVDFTRRETVPHGREKARQARRGNLQTIVAKGDQLLAFTPHLDGRYYLVTMILDLVSQRSGGSRACAGTQTLPGGGDHHDS
jgi:hypothetical protein